MLRFHWAVACLWMETLCSLGKLLELFSLTNFWAKVSLMALAWVLKVLLEEWLCQFGYIQRVGTKSEKKSWSINLCDCVKISTLL